MDDFFVSIAPVIIDDILTHDGNVHLGLLGGGGLHALAGCSIWSKKLGIIAGIGEDFFPQFPALMKIGIDTSALKIITKKTTRAWQIIQPGDNRVQVLRDPAVKINQITPSFSSLDIKYQNASGYHILWRGTIPDLIKMLTEIRQKTPNAIIVMEPTPGEESLDEFTYQQIFQLVDVFTPNISEGRRITTRSDPKDIIRGFIKMGCKTVVLRMGEKGSMGYGLDHSEILKIPAAEVEIIDITGAGNAFAGGLLYGLSKGKSLSESLAMASVSASFEIEQYGLCCFSEDKIYNRDSRYQIVIDGIKPIFD
jgi:sugar/nucleoside kinase (ribokinase family)